ncbi:MAG: hypothetical protein II966_02230, partial [Lachnospiraceae bacterium]|nr:hypothetical protein [Lachnospiraceae bacterium]
MKKRENGKLNIIIRLLLIVAVGFVVFAANKSLGLTARADEAVTARLTLEVSAKMSNGYWPDNCEAQYEVYDNNTAVPDVKFILSKNKTKEEKEITLTGTGDHTISVRHVTSDKSGGITFDSDKEITVRVSENSAIYEGDTVITKKTLDEFNNSYSASGSASVSVSAVLREGGTESTFFPSSGIGIGLFDSESCSDPSKMNRTIWSNKATEEFSLSYTLEDLKSGDTYQGSAEKHYWIKQTSVSDGVFSYEDKKYRLDVAITDKGDGTLEVKKTIEGGSGDQVITFNDTVNSSAIKTLEYAEVKLSQDSYTYDGTACTPTPTVTLMGKTLTKDTDYTVTYQNNIDAGIATVNILGTGAYSGAKSLSFTIEPFDLRETVDKSFVVDIKFNKTSYEYSGSACEPTPVFRINSTKIQMTKGTDYTLTYKDNVDAGKPTVTITGIGNYTNKRSFEYTITAKSINGATITFDNSSYEYTGSTIKNSISSVKLDGKSLKEDTDYEVVDTGKLSAMSRGTYTVQVKGKGNYKDTASASWVIKGGSSSSSSYSSYNSYSGNSGTYSGTSNSSRTTTSASNSNSSRTGTGSTTSTSSSTRTGSTAGTSGSGSSTTSSNSAGNSSSSSDSSTTTSSSSSNSSMDTGTDDMDSVSGNSMDTYDDELEDEVFDEALDEGGVELHPMAAASDGNVENLTGPVPGYQDDPPVKATVKNIMEAGKAILPAEEWSIVENGGELEFWIDVQPAEAEISEEDINLATDYMYNISDKVEGLCGGRYLNVRLFYQVDKGGWESAMETDAPIAIDFAVPESMKGVSEHFYGLCLHDGEAELLSDTNASKDVITVMTRWFD